MTLLLIAALLALVLLYRTELREEEERHAAELAWLALLHRTSAELALSTPERMHGGFVCRGNIHGCAATLVAGAGGYHELSVALTVVGLPDEITIAPRDAALHEHVTTSGLADLDAHYALYGNPATGGDALVALSHQIPDELLTVIVTHHAADRALHLTSRWLRLAPQTQGTAPPSEAELLALWHAAATIVDDGVRRGVFLVH